jgi:CHASE2 domain-containing sensor protein
MTSRYLEDIEAQWPSCRTREARRVLSEELTGSSGRWFAACREIVHQQDRRTLELWFDPNDSIKQDILNFDASRSAVLCAHLLCARLALAYDPDTTLDEFDRLLHPIAETTGCAPGFLRDLTWAFLPHEPSLEPERAEELYVLLVEEGRDQGVVGLLSLQLLPHGTGALYPQHELALVLRDSQFRQAEHEAHTYVDALGLWPEGKDVRWRLTRPFDNRPVRRLVGASMGAAFALGLSKLGASADAPHAAKLQALDLTQVAISATFDASGRLGKVAQTGPKILAVFDELPRELLRLIVVSSDCGIPLAWQTDPFSSTQVMLADTYDEAIDRLHQASSAAGRRKTRLGSTRQRWTKAVTLGLLTAIVGVTVSVMPPGLALEERFGLGALFHLRGIRPPPAEVVVVNVDRAVAKRLELPLAPEQWPRSLHAQLTQQLAQAGAAAIAFDILFEKARAPAQDQAFADAIRQARNVVLFAGLEGETVTLPSQGEAEVGKLHIERLVRPMPLLAQAATALAPLPLPKVPVNVSQYWTFKTGADEKPTLPVVMFHLFALDVYDAFRRLVEDVHPSQAGHLPRDREAILETEGLEAFIARLRHLFNTGQLDSTRLMQRLQQISPAADATREQTLLRSLIKLYQDGDSRYLNFYGPPNTLMMIPYDRVLRSQEGAVASGKPLDLRGKAVFVGFSEYPWSGKQDGFYTVFSQSDGSDISGVEVAATAFANLVEDMPVRVCGWPLLLLVVGLWGGALGAMCRLLPTGIAALNALGLGVVYGFAVKYQFSAAGTWYPLMIPLGLQIPLAFAGALLWRYVEAEKERQKIRRAMHYYLPQTSVEQFTKDVTDRSRSTRVGLSRRPLRQRFKTRPASPEQTRPMTTEKAP